MPGWLPKCDSVCMTTILSMVEHELGVSILAGTDAVKTNYHIAIRPIVPAVKRKMGFIAKNANELPLAGKYFIHFMMEHQGELL